MKLIHTSSFGGHMAYDRTYPLLRTRFFWPGMSTEYKAFLKACHPCAVLKGKLGISQPKLKQDICVEAMQRIAMDVMGRYELTA